MNPGISWGFSADDRVKMELWEDVGMATQHCPTLLLRPALLTAWLALRSPAEELGQSQAGLLTLLRGTTQGCLGSLPAVAISPGPGRKRKLQ